MRFASLFFFSSYFHFFFISLSRSSSKIPEQQLNTCSRSHVRTLDPARTRAHPRTRAPARAHTHTQTHTHTQVTTQVRARGRAGAGGGGAGGGGGGGGRTWENIEYLSPTFGYEGERLITTRGAGDGTWRTCDDVVLSRVFFFFATHSGMGGRRGQGVALAHASVHASAAPGVCAYM